MSRISLGIVTAVAALVLMAMLPVILGPAAVALWWVAIAVFVVGCVNVCRGVMEL